MATNEHPLPAQVNKGAEKKAHGFATPKEDKRPQCARMLPKRVLPIIFLPGIMGSNLRMSDARQAEMRRPDNIAWRPDSLGGTNIRKNSKSTARDRQLQLDPLQTTVDIYDPAGPVEVSGDGRHENVALDKDFHSPVLVDDPETTPNRRTAAQKARARGWGEVFFASYGALLQHLESRLNSTFFEGKAQPEWRDVLGVDPRKWGADASSPQKALTEDELKQVATGCWFAVYAFGYNWLISNGDSAKTIAARISKLIDDLTESGYECNQVIVVTHSMGGLVGRALVHPQYGNLQDKILGIVHGVMPSIGAPAGYKRMKAGFEDPGMFVATMTGGAKGIVGSIAAKVAGNYGDEVTAVLANSQGGLQLLPTESYGNGWLRVTYNGHELDAWPKKGDPYSEIYKLRGKWYSLFRDDWINPSGLPAQRGGGSFERTCNYLNRVQNFHRQIANTFHPVSYAHYGADRSYPAFGEVVWEIRNCADPTGWQNWPILADTRQGTVELVQWDPIYGNKALLPFSDDKPPESVCATILPPLAPGDQTVPAKSADHQLHIGVFKGIFRQAGYEHQSSYTNPRVVAATLYSIVRIAQHAQWKGGEGLTMNISKGRCIVGTSVVFVIFLLAACEQKPKILKESKMATLPPSLEPMFVQTKTVCFGRFVVDVPVETTLAWGEADIPLGVTVYAHGRDRVAGMEQKFIERLKNEKAIYKNNVPLLISIDEVQEPEGKIVTGYEDFESIDDLKINGYFGLQEDGFVVESRPLRDDKDEVIKGIRGIASRLRRHTETDMPTEPGNCIEYAFLPDEFGKDIASSAELIRVGFRFKAFPDTHLSIYLAPSNPHNPEGDSLEAQFKRIKDDPMTAEESKVLGNTKFFREKAREIHDWRTGYEVLMRTPDERDSLSHHDFLMKFIGVPHDPLKPYADIQMQTGVANNAAGATKASLTDEEALAVWDRITSTIRVRPTKTTSQKSAESNAPRFPLGELAATGRTCPQTGWWQSSEAGRHGVSGRQHFQAGERMPHVVTIGEPSLWQRIKGEHPTYRTATMWTLVEYGDAPAAVPTQAHAANDTGPSNRTPKG